MLLGNKFPASLPFYNRKQQTIGENQHTNKSAQEPNLVQDLS